MTKVFTAVLLIGCLLPCFLRAQEEEVTEPVTAEAYFDKAVISIGEKVSYIIRVEMPKGTKLQIPVVDQVLSTAGFAVRDFGENKTKKIARDKVREEYWYKLDTYVTGSYVVPEIVIEYTLPDGTRGEVSIQEVFLEVKSVIQEGEAADDIRDIKLPVTIPVSYKKLIVWSLVIILLLLLLLVGLPWLWKHRKKIIRTAPVLPAHVIALRELEKAKGLSVVTAAEIEEYYIRISSIVRTYIEKFFGICAPERTTEEFLVELTKEDTFKKEHKALLKEFLCHCDLVKFAKYGPTAREIEGVYLKAKQFVLETKTVEQ